MRPLWEIEPRRHKGIKKEHEGILKFGDVLMSLHPLQLCTLAALRGIEPQRHEGR